MQLIEVLDVPPLAPVPPEHVLTKSFYLMQEFPCRYDGGDVWVENSEETVHDGVSSVIIGSNDWSGALAVGASEIGRASCRERVSQFVLIRVVAVPIRKKNIKIQRRYTTK